MTNNDIVIIIPGSGATVNLFSQKILLFVNEELSIASSFMLFVSRPLKSKLWVDYKAMRQRRIVIRRVEINAVVDQNWLLLLFKNLFINKQQMNFRENFI